MGGEYRAEIPRRRRGLRTDLAQTRDVIRTGKWEPEEVSAAPNQGRWVLAATILGSSMAFIDGTVVNVALPNLQASLSATVADLQWVVEAYALFLAALILIGGTIGDLYGRKRIFATGVVSVASASAVVGFEPGSQTVIGARARAGWGGG